GGRGSAGRSRPASWPGARCRGRWRRGCGACRSPLTAHLAAELLPEPSVCLAISHSGATRSTVDTARRARAAGARVVAITSYASSPLAEESTWVLVGGGQDLVFGMEAVASRLAHLTIVDTLSMVVLALRGGAAERAVSASADVTADHSY
ncbi:SIS domain-containing protein, partial [Nonomuraea sp. NPDC003201]